MENGLATYVHLSTSQENLRKTYFPYCHILRCTIIKHFDLSLGDECSQGTLQNIRGFLYMSLGKWQIKCLLTEGGDIRGCLVANCCLKTSCLSLETGVQVLQETLSFGIEKH